MGTGHNITSVILGDIIQSRRMDATGWLPQLKKALSKQGKNPRNWQIFRGDSFQLEVEAPAEALTAAIHIKASIKTISDLDVRMSIGIGEKRHAAERVAESDGEAFNYSGEIFETLKKAKRNLAIKSPWPEFDHEMNVMLRLASIPMDEWTTGSAELVELLILHPTLTQEALAKKLNLTQPSVSERQNRSHLEEIMEMEKLYREKISKLIAGK